LAIFVAELIDMNPATNRVLEWLNNHAYLAFFVSAGAMVLTAILGIYSISIKKRLLKIEQEREREKQIQKEKAELCAKIEEDTILGRSGQKKSFVYKLLICNKGYADGRNVKVMLDGEPLSEHPDISDRAEEISDIKAKSEVSYLLNWQKSARLLSSKRLRVNITWKDGLGTQEWEQVLTPS